MSSTAVEIAVQDAAGVRIALEQEADRIELCAGLGLGGLTPSAGLLSAAVAEARRAARDGFVHVLVRPRGGDFVYDDVEVETAVRDIRHAVDVGADGVVVGALTDAGDVDRAALAAFVEAAAGLDVTFHRAFDVVSDRARALAALADAGARRVLTSGGAATAAQGRAELARLAESAAGRVQIMAGGGIRPDDVTDLIEAGVDAVHLSARSSREGAASGPGGGSTRYDVTDPDAVRAAVAAASHAL